MDAFEQIPKYVGGKEFIYKGSQYWGAAKEPPVFGAFTIGVLFTAFVLLIINHKSESRIESTCVPQAIVLTLSSLVRVIERGQTDTRPDIMAAVPSDGQEGSVPQHGPISLQAAPL